MSIVGTSTYTRSTHHDSTYQPCTETDNDARNSRWLLLAAILVVMSVATVRLLLWKSYMAAPSDDLEATVRYLTEDNQCLLTGASHSRAA